MNTNRITAAPAAKHSGPAAWVAILMLPAMLAGGCSGDPNDGYSNAPLYRQDVKTVAVPVWNVSKDVYHREVEFRLTEAIKKQVPYKIAPDASKADTVLEGTVERIDQTVLSFNPDTSDPREKEIIMTISFTWRDLRNGKVLAKKSSFAVKGNYISHSPFNEDFFLGSEDAINTIARRIVEQMEAQWGKK